MPDGRKFAQSGHPELRIPEVEIRVVEIDPLISVEISF
jgi:hypothetical protein